MGPVRKSTNLLDGVEGDKYDPARRLRSGATTTIRREPLLEFPHRLLTLRSCFRSERSRCSVDAVLSDQRARLRLAPPIPKCWQQPRRRTQQWLRCDRAASVSAYSLLIGAVLVLRASRLDVALGLPAPMLSIGTELAQRHQRARVNQSRIYDHEGLPSCGHRSNVRP